MKKWLVLLAAICVTGCAVPVSAAGTNWLEIGQISEDVYYLQVMLQGLGYYPYDLDGCFGSGTEEAVMWFQYYNGLTVDGIAGPYTMAALWKAAGYAPAAQTQTAEPAASTQAQTAEPAASELYSDTILYRGMSGSEVAQMQSVLVGLGFMENIVDGEFGSLTEAAVRRFQEANGLLVDGVAGPQTLNALKNYSGGAASQVQPTAGTQQPASAQDSSAAQQSAQTQQIVVQQYLYQGMSGNAVLDLQKKLAALGYAIYTDGEFGTQTAQVVMDFQARNGLLVDGVVGPQTAAMLNGSAEAAAPAATAAPEAASVVYDGVTLTEDVAAYMKNLVSKVTTSDMTKEEKLWACFLYIADRGNYPYVQNRIPYYTGEDWPVVYVRDEMSLGASDCHGYAAMFGYAAAIIGYDNVRWVQNKSHAWVEINGLVYDAVRVNSGTPTVVFGWTYEQAAANDKATGIGFDYLGEQSTRLFVKAPTF